jgi:ELWxxDGT repeat protein
MRRLTLASFSMLLASAALPALAETAVLLRDIRPSQPVQTFSEQGVMRPLLPAGRAMLFTVKAAGPVHEIWSSDGTIAGTRTICSGSCSSNAQALGTIGDVALFFDDIGSSAKLWRSDGTRPGTFPIAGGQFEELQPCPSFESGSESELVSGVLFFKGGFGCELWRTDGTAAGTRPVQGLNPEPESRISIRELIAWNDGLWFSGSDANGQRGLWRSDGSAATTALVRSFSIEPRFFTAVGSRLYFVAPDEGRGDELWVSDGTAAGTRLLTHFAAQQPFPDSFSEIPAYFQDIEGVFHFLADDVTGGLDLWRSDGTEAGTRRVTAFGNARPFSNAFNERQIVKLGSRLIFVATDGLTGFRLWTSGGTPETTAVVSACAGGSCPTVEHDAALVSLGGKALFLGTRPGQAAVVWSTDGTGSGTKVVRNLCSGHCSSLPESLFGLLGRALFIAQGPEVYEVWQTDGTEKGTQRLASIERHTFDENFGRPFEPVATRNTILFVAEDVNSNGQIWASDGTAEGTGPVTWLTGGGIGSDPYGFASDGGAAWFLAPDGTDNYLWRSEGTAATTVKTNGREPFVVARGFAFFPYFENGFEGLGRSDGAFGEPLHLTPAEGFVAGLVAFGDGVAFVFQKPEAGVSLWKSDGSVGGTNKLVDLPDSLGDLIEMTALGPELFLIGRTSVVRSDGTAGGTHAVDLGDSAYQTGTLTRMGNSVFFVGHSEGGRVWKLASATGPAAPLLPLDSPAGRNPSALAVFQGALYFLALDESFDAGLWKSDGTTAGTILLKRFPERSFFFGEQAEFAPAGGRLFFSFDDGVSGQELWRTDGTSAGTVLVSDIVPGPPGSAPSRLAAAGDRLFFAAADEEHGIELWESDGTEAGTRMVHDIAPGGPSSQPGEMTAAAGKLFFAADDGVHGREPWVLPLAQSGCQPSEEALCLGGRFRVEAFWRDFQGHFGSGKAVALTTDTGYFWFFNPANVEVVLKVLDGQGVNGHHWVFYGALSTVEYTLTVTDTQTGAARRYVNPPSRLGSVADTIAFGPLGAIGSNLSTGPSAAEWEPLTEVRTTVAAPCVESATRLCLQGGRFAVEAAWRDFQGNTGAGQAVPLAGGDTGYFWFFNQDNVEVVLKVLDGRPLNDKFWVFYGALSSVQYTLTVTDTQTGKVKKYENPSGRLASVADTGAF